MKKYLPSIIVLVVGLIVISFYRQVFVDVMHFFTKRDEVLIESKRQLANSLQAADLDWLDARQLYQAPLMQSYCPPLGVYGMALVRQQPELSAEQPLGADAGPSASALQHCHGVLACGQGLVVASGNAGEQLGWCVVLLHKTADGQYLQSVYSNLAAVSVRKNTLLEAGEELGKVSARQLPQWFANDFALQPGVARYTFRSKTALRGERALEYLQQHFAPAVILQKPLPLPQPAIIAR